MSIPTLRQRAGNLAFLLLLPALYLVIVSLTRRLFPGNPLYGGLETLGSAQTQVVTLLFSAASLLGPLLAVALCLLALVQLEWRREIGGVVATVRLRERLWPLITLAISVGILGLLALYAFFENFVPR
jgi:hypothetical protein